MDEPIIDNPASRLFLIMQRVAAAAPNTAMEGWAVVLQCAVNPPEVLLMRFSHLHSLKTRCRLAIQQHCQKSSLYLRPYERLDDLMRPHRFPESWATIRGLLDGNTLGMLEAGADQLEGLAIEPVWDMKEANALISEVEGLITDVKAAPLPVPLREALLEHLEAMHRVLAAYIIIGPSGLRSVLAESLGMLILQSAHVKEASNTPVMKRFMGVIARIGRCLDVTAKLLDVGEKIKQLGQ